MPVGTLTDENGEYGIPTSRKRIEPTSSPSPMSYSIGGGNPGTGAEMDTIGAKRTQ
jgi:hypothetical protein